MCYKAMGKINLVNIKKTIYYLKRNGVMNTWYAVKERMEGTQRVPYSYCPISSQELEEQRKWSAERETVFSIVVPAYRTREAYLLELIQSVEEQSYPHWELILADATEDDSVETAFRQMMDLPEEKVESVETKLETEIDGAEQYESCAGEQLQATLEVPRGTGRVLYVKLEKNAGIAANTNQALKYATGDYVGLLDHDDVLTPDALYEMAVPIETAREQGITLQMLYSDEDKCNGDRTLYYEPHRKENFNPDLLLSNNYICHFLVMKRELIQSLGFRAEYDGAQDYDLVLRAAEAVRMSAGEKALTDRSRWQNYREQIVHIPKVLYHWRCHIGSTAENPQSKQYAYDAGLRALQDYADRCGFQAKAVHLKHLGFYALEYPEGILESRQDLGAVGGRVLGYRNDTMPDDGPVSVVGNKKKAGMHCGLTVIGGRMSSEGDVYYEGTPAGYSGYLHRAILTQTAEAVDIRCIQVRKECEKLFEQVTGVPYVETNGNIFDVSTLPEGTDCREVSLKLCRSLQEAGYDILYYPAFDVRISS